MPGLAWLVAVWDQTVGTTMTQHMQINNSLVILIFVSLEEFCSQLYSLVRFAQERDAGGIPGFSAQSSTELGCSPLRAGHSGHSGPARTSQHAVRLVAGSEFVPENP